MTVFLKCGCKNGKKKICNYVKIFDDSFSLVSRKPSFDIYTGWNPYLYFTPIPCLVRASEAGKAGFRFIAIILSNVKKKKNIEKDR